MVKKFQALTIAMAACGVVLTGCESPNGQTNNTVTDAQTGSIIGSQMDREQAEHLREQSPDTYVRVGQGRPLMISDVKALVRAHVSDDAIVGQIKSTHTIYHLSPADIVDLHNSGVSDKVVNYMIGTASLPVPPPPPPLVVQSDYPPDPPPATPPPVSPGPGYVWISGEWQSSSEGWVWTGGQWAIPPWPGAVWVPGYWYRGPISGWRHAPGHWR